MDNELLEPNNELDPRYRVDLDAFDALKTTQAAEMVQAVQNREIASVAANDGQIKDKLNANAKGILDTHAETIAQDVKLENRNAKYRLNKFACDIYGVDMACPIWQQRLMKIGAAFWFIIYWLFASITIVPVNTFLQMVGNIVKNNFCKWLLSLLFYSIILFVAAGTPILVKYIQGGM